jgi:hypothetical protein
VRRWWRQPFWAVQVHWNKRCASVAIKARRSQLFLSFCLFNCFLFFSFLALFSRPKSKVTIHHPPYIHARIIVTTIKFLFLKEWRQPAIGADFGLFSGHNHARAQCNSIGTDGRRMDSARQETHTRHTHTSHKIKGVCYFGSFFYGRGQQQQKNDSQRRRWKKPVV